MDCWECGPFWWENVWWQDGESAPPRNAVLSVAGWARQTSCLPWRSISPLTISTGGKYGTSRNGLEPKTFQWIMEHDSIYVKLVLENINRHRDYPNMQQLYMYLREHYEPTQWKRYIQMEEMQQRLAEWRQSIAFDNTVEETKAMADFRKRAIAAEMTAEAVRRTTNAALDTVEAAWMTTQAARATAEAASRGTSASSDFADTKEPQPKKQRI